MELSQKDILCELGRRDIRYFIKYTHKNYIFSDFSLTVMKALEQFLIDLEQEQRPILIIEAPPQHGKSELASRKFPAYALGKNPNYRIAGCSYSSDLAISMNRDIQRIMLDDSYASIFPNSSLNKKRAATMDNEALRNSDRFDIIGHKGYYVCCGVGGALTGKSVDIGIIDDPVKNMQEARSQAIKENLINWYQSVFLTRLSKNSGQLIMATRWAVDDLIGYIIEKNKDNKRVKILKFPAINEKGQALIPELHPLEQLLEQKEMMDNSSWSALYQQEPILIGGNIIKGEWFRTYEILPKFKQIYITADTAMKVKEANDYSVLQCWGRTELNGFTDYYLIDMLRGKWESPELLERTQLFYLKYKKIGCSCLFIEDKASGTGLIQSLQRKRIPVQAITPLKDKYMRLSEVLPLIKSGYVYIPEKAEWKLDFLSECEAFSADMSHVHDDMIDAMTMGLSDKTNFFTLKNII